MNQSINKKPMEISLFGYVAILIFGLQFLGGFMMYIGDVASFSNLKNVLFPLGAVLLTLGCFRAMAVLPGACDIAINKETNGCSIDRLKTLIALEPIIPQNDKWMYVVFSKATRRLILEKILKNNPTQKDTMFTGLM
jgi:hypothetical protein